MTFDDDCSRIEMELKKIKCPPHSMSMNDSEITLVYFNLNADIYIRRKNFYEFTVEIDHWLMESDILEKDRIDDVSIFNVMEIIKEYLRSMRLLDIDDKEWVRLK